MAITLCLDGAATQQSDSDRYQKHENLSISARHVELSSTDVTCSYSTPVCFNSGGKIAFVHLLCPYCNGGRGHGRARRFELWYEDTATKFESEAPERERNIPVRSFAGVARSCGSFLLIVVVVVAPAPMAELPNRGTPMNADGKPGLPASIPKAADASWNEYQGTGGRHTLTVGAKRRNAK